MEATHEERKLQTAHNTVQHVKGDHNQLHHHIRNKSNRNYFIIRRYIVKFLSSGYVGPWLRNETSQNYMITLLERLTNLFILFLLT